MTKCLKESKDILKSCVMGVLFGLILSVFLQYTYSKVGRISHSTERTFQNAVYLKKKGKNKKEITMLTAVSSTQKLQTKIGERAVAEQNK